MPTLSALLPMAPAFNAGLALSLSLIMALGAQNTHVIRMGLQGQHVVLTVVVCIASDILLIGLGVVAMAQLGGLGAGVKAALICGGVVFLLVAWVTFVSTLPKFVHHGMIGFVELNG